MGSVTEYVLAYAKSKNKAPDFTYGTTTAGKKYPINNAGNGMAILTFPPRSVKFSLDDGIVRAQDMSGGNIKTILLNDVDIQGGTNVNEFSLDG